MFHGLDAAVTQMEIGPSLKALNALLVARERTTSPIEVLRSAVTTVSDLEAATDAVSMAPVSRSEVKLCTQESLKTALVASRFRPSLRLATIWQFRARGRFIKGGGLFFNA